LIICFCLSLKIKAQEYIIPNLEDIIEEIASASDVELDYTTLFSSLENLYYDPLDINSANEEDLNALIFLTEFQIYSIINYRHKYGNYKTIYELQFVDGMDIISIKRLLPFITVKNDDKKQSTSIKNTFSYGKHRIITRYQRLLQEKAGYKISDSIIEQNPDKSRYLGSPDKMYFKYAYQYKNKLSYGITAEKDDGEQFMKGAQKYGFDFYSGHFQINNIGILKKVIVGDYVAQFGQGLTMWSGLSFGKTTNTTNIIKKAQGVNKYTSVNELAFFRGEAATIELGNFNFTEFVSYKSIDGSIDGYEDTTSNSEEYITSFLTTGYHRTPSEIIKRKTIKEFIAGGNFKWSKSNLKIGATGVFYNFSYPFGGNDKPYTYFNFKGRNNFNFGADYLWSVKNIILFGEIAMSYNPDNIGFASVNGATMNFTPQFKMSLLHRYYQPNHQALYAQPFSEGNKPNNETGIFIGTEIFPVKKWKIDAYIDFWKYKWLRYGINGPSAGMDYMIQTSYFPKRNFDMYLRLKHEVNEKNSKSNEYGISPIIPQYTTKIKYHTNYSISETLKLKNIIEISNYKLDNNTQWGYLICQDIQYIISSRVPLLFIFRVAVFDTDSYDTRIYAYEPDVMYGFSVPAYYNNGSRLVFVLKYTIFEGLNFWVRIANTYYHNQNGLGSGLDAIEGKNRTDVKLQLQFEF
jgi:hypothetical protein